MVAALAAFGARGSDVDAASMHENDEPFEVYPENWEAVQVFVAMSTQWRTVAVGGLGGGAVLHVGLDYAALPAVFELSRIKSKRRAAVFQQLRVMEQEALDVLLSERS